MPKEARLCMKCGRTESGWRYNRCPNCGELANAAPPDPQALLERLVEALRDCLDELEHGASERLLNRIADGAAALADAQRYLKGEKR